MVATQTDKRFKAVAFEYAINMPAKGVLAMGPILAAALISKGLVSFGVSHVQVITARSLKFFLARFAIVALAFVARRPSGAHYIADNFRA